MMVKVLFWLDQWCGPEAFKDKFPLLYEQEIAKRCYVTERITDSQFTWRWKAAIRGEEIMAEFINLCTMINNIRMTPVTLGFRFNLNRDGITRLIGYENALTPCQPQTTVF
ncbi:hypothetical protein LXL04_006305 [Taraxacum kok-saghyz]